MHRPGVGVLGAKRALGGQEVGAVLYLVRRLRQPAIGHGVGLVGFLEGNRISSELLGHIRGQHEPVHQIGALATYAVGLGVQVHEHRQRARQKHEQKQRLHDEGGAGPHGPLLAYASDAVVVTGQARVGDIRLGPMGGHRSGRHGATTLGSSGHHASPPAARRATDVCPASVTMVSNPPP